MKKVKNFLLWTALILESAVIAIALLLGGFCLLISRHKQLLKELSPNQDYPITVTELGEPAWPFGSDKIRVSLYENVRGRGKYQVEFDALVANDGGKADYKVEWMDDGVQIVLIGSEQPDAYYFLPFEQ